MNVKQQKFQNDQSVSDWTNDETYSTLIMKSCSLNHGSFHLIQSPHLAERAPGPRFSFLASAHPSQTPELWALTKVVPFLFWASPAADWGAGPAALLLPGSADVSVRWTNNIMLNDILMVSEWKALESIHFASKVSRKCFWENVISIFRNIFSKLFSSFMLHLCCTFRAVTASFLHLMSSEMCCFCSLTIVVSSCTRKPDFLAFCWERRRAPLRSCSSAVNRSQASFTLTALREQDRAWSLYQIKVHLWSDRIG